MRDVVFGEVKLTSHGLGLQVNIIIYYKAVGSKSIVKGQVGLSAFFCVRQNFLDRRTQNLLS